MQENLLMHKLSLAIAKEEDQLVHFGSECQLPEDMRKERITDRPAYYADLKHGPVPLSCYPELKEDLIDGLLSGRYSLS